MHWKTEQRDPWGRWSYVSREIRRREGAPLARASKYTSAAWMKRIRSLRRRKRKPVHRGGTNVPTRGDLYRRAKKRPDRKRPYYPRGPRHVNPPHPPVAGFIGPGIGGGTTDPISGLLPERGPGLRAFDVNWSDILHQYIGGIGFGGVEK